jgi:hypothetical protein
MAKEWLWQTYTCFMDCVGCLKCETRKWKTMVWGKILLRKSKKTWNLCYCLSWMGKQVFFFISVGEVMTITTWIIREASKHKGSKVTVAKTVCWQFEIPNQLKHLVEYVPKNMNQTLISWFQYSCFPSVSIGKAHTCHIMFMTCFVHFSQLLFFLITLFPTIWNVLGIFCRTSRPEEV